MKSFKSFITEAKIVRSRGTDYNRNEYIFVVRDGNPSMGKHSITTGMDEIALKANGTSAVKKAVKSAVASSKDSKDLTNRLNKISHFNWKSE